MPNGYNAGPPRIRVDIAKYDVYRGPNVGVYAAAGGRFVFLPGGFAPAKAERLAGLLGAEPVLTTVGGTRVVGAMMVANSGAALLPATAHPAEISAVERAGLKVRVLQTRHNALGNLIAANDRCAVVSPLVEPEAAEKAGDALDVDVVVSRVAGRPQSGALLRANSSGGIVHPDADDEQVRALSKAMGAQLEPATVNGGVPFVSSGVLLNDRRAVVGSYTTGPEIMMLTRALQGGSRAGAQAGPPRRPGAARARQDP